jgi:hypothetical protein
MMPFKVADILLVSSFYDEFIIEEEGLISELIIGEYRHLLLSSPPKVTRVNSGHKAMARLKEQKYDLVITMSKNIGMNPYTFGRKVKNLHPTLPVVLLATESSDVRLIVQQSDKRGIDRAFFWTGDPILFLTIIKYIEDVVNTHYDTRNGNVRVIIMIEDSIRYYSMFLPIIYTEIVRQTRRIISEDLNEMQRLLTRRARPKILLAETYEEGMELFLENKDYILGIITDVRFPRNGKADRNAGHTFSSEIRKISQFIPILMQSTNPDNRANAEDVGTFFLDKNSPSLMQEFQDFMLNHLGFGDFTFLKPKGKQGRKKVEKTVHGDLPDETVKIARAANMQEFVEKLQEVPRESIQFHAERNHFSNWLFARCEFRSALEMYHKKVSDFTTIDEIRKYLLEVFNESRRDKQRAVIADFSQQTYEFESSFTRLTGDSLGGKGRGIAFIRSLLARYNLESRYKDINIMIPSTVVIGTLEFDRFIAENKLMKLFEEGHPSDQEIANAFLKGRMNKELKDKLSKILNHFKSPLAIRSSGLLEDSKDFPFAGLYRTYMLPNNHAHKKVRLKQLCQAIKLVYASVFFEEARSYIESTSSKVEEEKMAVIIQKLVGHKYGTNFYPNFSGVIQSYNFYPVSHQTPEEGIASVAVGLGKTVVSGEKVLRFSPHHPGIIPEFSSTELMLKNSQTKLYALDMSGSELTLSEKEDVTLKKLDISDIRDDGSLTLLASTYNMNDGVIRDGLSLKGPPIVTFSSILKYDTFPLCSILKDLVQIAKTGMGCSVELEFAVTFDPERKAPPALAVLQTRPLALSYDIGQISLDKNNNDDLLISSDKALGNGVTDSIRDIVYIVPKKFDSSKTIEIAQEVGTMNTKLTESSSPYILIGPGRWGTLDRWLGVPVKWNQISGVSVMVETALEDFNIEPSQGTHFFQNVVARGIGYIYAGIDSQNSYVDWSWMAEQKVQNKLEFVGHIHLHSPITVKIDGRSGHAIVEKPQ